MTPELSVEETEKLVEQHRNNQESTARVETVETNKNLTNTEQTNESSAPEDSVANVVKIHINNTTNSVVANENHNMTEGTVSLIDERKYVIKSHVLPVLKYILRLIIVHNFVGIFLAVAFLLFNSYVYSFFTLLAIITPIFIMSCVSYKWESITDKNSNVCRNILYELTKYKYFKEYTNCQKIINEYKVQNNIAKYVETIRNIEDLRYFTLTNALLYSSTQMFAQGIIIIYFYNLYILPLQIGVILLSVVLKLLCIMIFSCRFCDFKNDLGIYRVSMFIYFINLMSMLLYLSDILSDFIITIKYLYNEHYIRGTLTLLFIIVPGVFNTWHEYFRQKLVFKVKKTKILTMLLNLNPVFGYWKSVQLLKQTRQSEMNNNEQQQQESYLAYVNNNFIVASSRYNECFTESCSQMIIQLSFLLLTVNFSVLMDKKLHILNIVSSIISVMNVAVSLVLFFRSKRVKQYQEDSLPIQGMVIQFLGYIPIASRIISLSFLASQHPYFTFLGIFLHWFFVMLSIVYTTKQYNPQQLLNNIMVAIVYVYTPAINTKTVEIIFQIIIFVENVVAMLVWNLSKYGRITIDGILILMFAVVLPSVLGWICRYLYRTHYDSWIAEFEENRSKRLTKIC